MRRKTDSAELARLLSRISLLSQLGLSVVTPPILAVWGALWLQNRFGWGDWVFLCAILLGIFSGVTSVFQFVRREAAREARRSSTKTEKTDTSDTSDTSEKGKGTDC